MKDLKKKIVLGTWSLSGDLGPVKTKNTYELIDYSIKKGLKEFDIAPTYGFGKIDKIFSKFRSEKIRINTKIGYDSERKKNFSIKVLRKSIYTSYDYHGKLNTVFLHNPRNEIKKWDLIIEMLNYYKKRRLIKFSGNFNSLPNARTSSLKSSLSGSSSFNPIFSGKPPTL